MAARLIDLPVCWENVRAVIFDVDGTLYDQQALRRLMFRDLVIHHIRYPTHWKDLLILREFRRMRERMADREPVVGDFVQIITRMIAEKYQVSARHVVRCTSYWILTHPLHYLQDLRFPGLLELCRLLQENSVQIAAFSDYPAHDKLKALGMPAMEAVTASDESVNRLKPDPKGLIILAERLRIPIENCLLIGDRDDRDGECARRAGMPYLIKIRQPAKPWHFRNYEECCESIQQLRAISDFK
jgi:FMN phosphatase YigB (HAD superfamily)